MYYLRIKTQKVQSFIFKIPRLKTMLGANSLLGEFFVKELPNLRKEYPISKQWDEFSNANQISEKLSAEYKWQKDDICDNFQKGVICSAGGHFETFFDDKEKLDCFIKKVKMKAKEKIPGVKLSFYIKDYEKEICNMTYKEFCSNGQEITDIASLIVDSNYHIDNPFFSLAGDDGENPEIFVRNGFKETKTDSVVTKLIKKHGDKFSDYKTNDTLCDLLKEIKEITNKDFPDNLGKKPSNTKEKREENEDNDKRYLADASLIPSNNKIAIIAIDGNAMGERFNKKRKELQDMPVFDALVEFEKFWFKQREIFRKALTGTIQNYDFSDYKDFLPFNILMLGGDDLLMVTVPEIAIP
ncbi:MAG: hypothetical protein WC234_04555, partial [Endomicrobiaceae bacterium]